MLKSIGKQLISSLHGQPRALVTAARTLRQRAGFYCLGLRSTLGRMDLHYYSRCRDFDPH